MAFGIDWKQRTESVSPEQIQFAPGETRMALVGETDFQNIVDGTAVKSILGFGARRNPGPPSLPYLTRVPPMKCPLAPWLRAEKITACQFIDPSGNEIRPDADVPYAVYDKARLTVLFSTPIYPIFTDQEMTAKGYADESYRYTRWSTFPNVEISTVPGGSFQFTNGPYSGNTFNQAVTIRFPKSAIVVKWFNVPALCLLDPTDPPWDVVPQKIMKAVGKVNSDDWRGFRHGELLCLPPRIEPVMEPVPPEVLGLVPGDVPRSYNVEFHFSFFDSLLDPGVIYDFYGHNLFPPPQRPAIPTSNYFYQALRGGAGGAKLYEEVSFGDLFKSI